jgi:mRNA interferase HigB
LRAITFARLQRFWEGRGGDAVQAREALEAWYGAISGIAPRNFAELRETFRRADQVGDCVVFNIGGHRSRLIARLRYRIEGRPGQGRAYVLRAMDHDEYDRNLWPDQCGCHRPPPRRARPRRPSGRR